MQNDHYNIPSEKALLSLVVRQPDYVRELGLSSDDFSPQMGRIWTAIANAWGEGRIITDIELNTIAPKNLVDELINAPSLPYGIAKDYVPLIQQETDKRRSVTFAENVYAVATSPSVAPSDKRPMISDAFVRWLREGVLDGENNSDYMAGVYAEYEGEYAGQFFRAIFTGIPDLDKKLIIGKTGVYVWAARPGVGKTQFFLSWLWNKANLNLRSIYGSVEMLEHALAKRIINTKAQINPLWMALNELPMDKNLIARHREAVGLYQSHFNANKRDPRLKILYGTYFEDFISRVRRHHYKNPVDVVFLDHISMMRLRTFSGRPSDRHREVADMMGQLNDLTNELQRPICMASQLNRGSSISNREPGLADLKESSSIEEVAHTTTFMFPDPSVDEDDFEDMEARPIVWKIAKSRTGALGRGGLQFNASIGTYQQRELPKKGKNK